jgi:hypothetical protein
MIPKPEPTKPLSIAQQIFFLKKIGTHIREQRIKIFNLTEDGFAEHLNATFFKDTPISKASIESIENGDGAIPMVYWMGLFQAMHVAEKIVDATKSDGALFLASAQRLNLTEEAVLKHTPK